jgi:alkylation response protein AidB-like acyl-CoA dehydrogenase
MPEHLPEAVVEVRELVKAFIQDSLIGLESRLEAAGTDAERAAIMAMARDRSRELGLFYKTQPEAYGGKPATALELTMIRELLAEANLKVGSQVLGPGPGILANATGDLREHYLGPVLRGEKRGAFGFTEPETAERPTWAERVGDSLYITGCKSYVTGGDTCDFITVLVNVQESADHPGGTAMVVVDRQASGLTVDRRFNSLDGSHHVSISMDRLQVPVSRVIGKIGEGMPRALRNIGNVRLMVAARATGISLAAINIVRRHLLAPHRSGTPLGAREGVRLRYADMRIDTYAARSMLYRTARLADSGENAVNETMMTKVFCTETAGRIVDMAVQLVGGQALVDGHPLEDLYRRVRALRLAEGASDLLRINIIKGDLEMDLGRL